MQFDPGKLFSLQGKTAAVVGGSGVLGGVFCRALAEAGAQVAVIGRTPAKVEERHKELADQGLKNLPVAADASDRSEVERAYGAVTEAFGRVDILVNAPGINSTTPFFEIDDDEWRRIMDVNLKSMFLTCQVFGRGMVEQGGGSIINVSSISSGPPLSRVFTYSVSKSGVNNLTQWLAREFAPHNVRVNALIPGFFPAEQNRKILSEERVRAILGHTPLGRLGEPEELAGAVIWLASDRAAGFVTGALIRVDGGFSAMTI